MKRFRIGFFVGAVATLAVVNGCFIGTDDFSKACKKDGDCPKIGGYLCASDVKWPQAVCDVDAGESCQCEVKFPPDPIDAGYIPPVDSGYVDAGMDAGPPPVDAGPVPEYCTDIRPTLQAKCLYTCHSAQMGYPGSPRDFRLDYYEPPDGGPVNDGGLAFLPGVKDKAGRCFSRITTGDMPPEQQVYPAYSAAEKLVFSKWIAAGMPFGSGCEGPPDAGNKDGGTDSGTPISFSTDIQPILTASCALTGCHTGGTPTGMMNLSTGNAYNALVNVNTSNGCNAAGSKRVLAFDFKNSMLWQKLTPDGGYCNNSMPRNMQILRMSQPANFAKIEAWITQGAKNN